MGTETLLATGNCSFSSNLRVKLNNPLMGTETSEKRIDCHPNNKY